MQRALTLLHRHLDDLATSAETEELFRQIALDPALADAWARLGRVEALLEELHRDDRADLRAAALLGPTTMTSQPRRRRRFLFAATAAGLLLALTTALIWRGSSPESTQRTDVVSGKIRLDGRESDHVTEGGTIEVVGDVPALIRLADGARAELAPASEAVVRGRSEGLRQTVELGRGGGKFQVGDGGRFRVRTPAGSVTAGPAEFTVELQPVTSNDEEESMLGKKSLLLVVAALVGDLEVSNSGRRYVVAAGQTRAFAADGKEVTGKPNAGGRIVAVAADGSTLTIEGSSPKPGVEPTRTVIKITDRTRVEYRHIETESGKKPTIGYAASVWLQEGSTDVAAVLRLEAVQLVLTGRVTSVAADGKSFTLEVAADKPESHVVKIADGAKVVYSGIDKESQKPTVGHQAKVWMRHGAKDVASGIQFAPPGYSKPDPEKKPPVKEPTKPDPEKKPPVKEPTKPDPEKKPPVKEPGKPDPEKKFGKPEPVFPLPTRHPAPVVAAIDREWRRALDEAKVAPAAEADDAEFLRRVSLDLSGRVPSLWQARAFLDSKEPDKRRRLIDQLLSNKAYGQHLASSWRRLITPPDDGVKPQPDVLSPWLTEQFNHNRGWGEVVRELITAEGSPRNNPQMAFILANSETLRPVPEQLADATSRLFLGMELRCAQCHDHPFVNWKQSDFWGLAAFYGRLRPDSLKGGPNLKIGEMDPPPGAEKKGPEFKGAAIYVSAQTGRQAGKVIRARFPRGIELEEKVEGPYRARLVDWMTARDNPYFARTAVNRMWAGLFGRGLVMPLDGFDESNPASNPALLDLLAKEFAESGYDMKHLLRCLTLSQAYQRTSQTETVRPGENHLFRHMAVKPLSPEELFDSLQVVAIVDKSDPAAGRWPGVVKDADLVKAREQFIRFFRAQHDGSETGGLNQGIPQVLRLMNGPALGEGAPVIESLLARKASREEIIETLILVAYARRPMPGEVELFSKYLAKQSSERDGAAGMLWILLNSSEFLLNH